MDLGSGGWEVDGWEVGKYGVGADNLTHAYRGMQVYINITYDKDDTTTAKLQGHAWPTVLDDIDPNEPKNVQISKKPFVLSTYMRGITYFGCYAQDMSLNY